MNPVVSSRHTEVRESPANNQLNIIRQKRKKIKWADQKKVHNQATQLSL